MLQSRPKEVALFVAEARAFVSLCKQQHDGESESTFEMSVRRLAGLYYAALALPVAPFQDAPDPLRADSDQKRLTENLALLPFQFYAEPLEPANLDKNGDLAIGDLI